MEKSQEPYQGIKEKTFFVKGQANFSGSSYQFKHFLRASVLTVRLEKEIDSHII